ncbi:MAG: xylulokinase [Candidatus Thorarchaeota archaeon]|nr:xylulokinase [Candidatus Thorarchaeota archaeon]
MSNPIVAIDVGTTGVRSMLFDVKGAVLSRAYMEFESRFPSPSWVEQDAESWWTATCETLKRMLKDAPCRPSEIAAVSITNQRETVVPVDSHGKPLRNAIVWQDRRTTAQCEWIRNTVAPEEVYQTTGLTIDPYFTAPKLLWMKENEPDKFRAAETFLLVHDYIVFRLTGQRVTDFSNASRTMLFDIRRGDWSDRMLDALDIPRDKLPAPVESGTVVGETTPDASRATGLAKGTPVVAGGGDQQCAALGVGVVRPGSIKATTGTGTFMLAYSESVRLDPLARVLCSRHVVPGAFVVEASMFTTGSALRWFRDQLGAEERMHADEMGVDPYDVMTEEASAVPAGSEGVLHLPHFVGAGAPYWNPNSRGAFVGLALGHTRKHLMRAVLEGVAYDLRTNLDVMSELVIKGKELRVTGGAARSEVWMQIQADVLGIPVIRTEMEEATAVGAAILACKGVGLFKSVADAAEGMVRVRPPLVPTSAHREVYDMGFKRYKALYSALSSLSLS